jgi:hypothetical protein
MYNARGNLTLNGVTDEELVKLLDIKIKHESSLNFNPQQMQTQALQVVGKQVQTYNNVVLNWTNEDGLEAVETIVTMLLKKDEQAKAVGQ